MSDIYYFIEIVLIYALGVASGCTLFLVIIWVAEKTGHKRDFYYNPETEYYESEDE